MVVVSNHPEIDDRDDHDDAHGETEPMINKPTAQIFLSETQQNPSKAKEACNYITSSMRAEPLQIQSPKTALQLLSTAIQLQNMPLVTECIKNLDEHLDVENVLMIYSHLSDCKMPMMNKNDFEPSAPPIIEDEDQRGKDWVQESVNNLRYNCQLVIDKEADVILKKKEFSDLSYNDIYSILSRDSLEVSSELVVYVAMYNWGIAECNRMTLSILHLQEVLRQLRFTPRYGLMSKKDFCSKYIGLVKGPTKSGVLDEKEWRFIRFYIEQKMKNKSVIDLDHRMSKKRSPGKERPKKLSCKSLTRYEAKTSRVNAGKQKCDLCLMNFLTCWAAIFD